MTKEWEKQYLELVHDYSHSLMVGELERADAIFKAMEQMERLQSPKPRVTHNGRPLSAEDIRLRELVNKKPTPLTPYALAVRVRQAEGLEGRN
jgi:hypothetical protein